MSEDVKVQFQSYPSAEEASPNYTNPNYEPLSTEPSVVISMQNDFLPYSKFHRQREFVKRHYPGFLIGLLVCLLIFLLCNVSAKKAVQPTDKTDCNKRIIGYYGGWSHLEITEYQIKKFTHIIFNGIKLEADGRIKFNDDKTRLLFFDMKNKTREMKPDVKILFSTDNYSDNKEHVAEMMIGSKTRREWIISITGFIIDQQIDGVELYYRWPETEEQKRNYVFFIRELRYKFENIQKMTKRNVPYIISVLAPDADWHEDDDVLLHEILDYADFLNVETDSYYGSWRPDRELTGPIAPLYAKEGNKSVDFTMNAYACKTSLPSRLNFMIAFSGTHWIEVDDHIGLTSPVYRNASKEHNRCSLKAWRNFESNGFNLTLTSWHDESRTPYIWDSQSRKLVTFENERSIRGKMKYLAAKNLGGVIVEHIEADDDENTLLNAVTSVDLCSGPKYKKR